MTDRRRRSVVAGVGMGALALALAYLFAPEAVAFTWPYPITRLTFVFLAALSAAFAAPLLWVAWTGELGGLYGVGVDLALAFAGVMVGLVVLGAGVRPLPPVSFAIYGLATVAGVWLALIGRRRPMKDARPMPRAVRSAFWAFAALLVTAALLLISRVPDVLPWQIDQDSASLVGWIFLGSAAYFVVAARRGARREANGPLLAFLAYDVVLIVPFTEHFATVRPEHRLGLVVYVAVLVVSSILAIAFLTVEMQARKGARASIEA
jgi:hypothetical protein